LPPLRNGAAFLPPNLGFRLAVMGAVVVSAVGAVGAACGVVARRQRVGHPEDFGLREEVEDGAAWERMGARMRARADNGSRIPR
jgi:hypothetical protein